jgi:glutathione peroxidase
MLSTLRLALCLTGALTLLATTACSDDAGATPDGGTSADKGASADSGVPIDGASGDRGLPDISLPDGPTPDQGWSCDPPAKTGEFWALEAKDLETVSMCRYRGMAILLVNIAAKCGFTPQLGDLAAMHKQYQGQGFTVLGFYTNQFLQAGTESEQQSCESSYGVTFPTFENVAVNPPGEHPVFSWLKSQPGGAGAVAWNFEKFLIGRDGKLIQRWKTATTPTNAQLVKAVQDAIAAPKP